jgi:hypothetical protein
MKIILKKCCCVVAFSCLLLVVAAQEEVKGLKQVFDITVDELGNATVEVSMKLNASQWDMFKRNVGNNSSVLKREIEKSLPKYFLSDFNYSEDAMDRSYKLKFKALGLASINSNGKWESKLETKDPDITKLSDRDFVMNMDYATNGMLIQQTQKIHLPPSAQDAKIEKDSFGKAIMTYSTGAGMASRASLFVGIGLILAAGVLFIRNSQQPKNKLRVADKQSSMVA